MYSFYPDKKKFAGSKAISFLKKSFLFALLYATLLYVAVRIFFYDFPFTILEGFELHSKMLLIVWAFMISCKLLVSIIILAEKIIPKITLRRILDAPFLKAPFLIILPLVLPHAGNGNTTRRNRMLNSGNEVNDESSVFTEEISC